MVIIAPRPFLLGVANLSLTIARQTFAQSVPVGAWWRLKYVLVDYPRTVVAGAQTTPDLLFRAFDADGRAFHVDPVLFPQVTSPAGAPGLDATNPINIDYPGGTSVRLEITGQIIGTGPATVSITLYGLRGWEGYGK